jgi:hypothetical protein
MDDDHVGSPLVDDARKAVDIEWLYPTGLLSVFDHEKGKIAVVVPSRDQLVAHCPGKSEAPAP